MIEELLLKQLQADQSISGLLTTYGGQPAVFYQNAPQDTDQKWEGSCYPRVHFLIDRRGDPERKTSGTLEIHVYTSANDLSPTGGNLEREIEILLIERISGAFYSPLNSDVIGAEWVRSDLFVDKSTSQSTAVEVYGVSLNFDLVAFPTQITTDPDPVQGANDFLKQCFPEAIVLGADEIPEVWKPSDEKPAMYWRFTGYEGDIRQCYSVNWYLAVLALHVFTESVGERNRWIKAATELIQMQGEILMVDHSPMFVKKVMVLHEGDPLRDGQMRLTGEFGVLVSQRKETAQNPLNRVIMRDTSKAKEEIP